MSVTVVATPAVVNIGFTNVFTLHHPNKGVESGTLILNATATLFVNLTEFCVVVAVGIVIVVLPATQ